MKRIIVIATIGLIAAGSVFAQVNGPRGIGSGQAVQNAESVKVEGKLALVNGFISVTTKDKTYYVMGIQRLIGFIDGLKEGASVKVEGDAFQMPMAPEYLVLRATKLSFAGKDYDLSYGRGFGSEFGSCYGPGATGGRMMGRWDNDDWGGPRGGRGYRY